MTDGGASAGARGETCGHPTTDSGECDLPASRTDGRCHIHTEADVDGLDAADDYDAMAATLDVVIEEMRRKIKEGRVRDVDTEKVRIKRARALAYVVNVRRQVTTDRDLEELTEAVEELQAQQNGTAAGVGVSTR